MKHLIQGNLRPPFLRRTKLRTRLAATFLLISVLPCLVLMLFSMRVYSSSIRQKLTTSAQQSMQLLDNNLTFCLEESSSYISTLSVSPTVQSCLLGEASTATMRSLFNAYSPYTARNNGQLLATVLLDADRNVVYNYGGMITLSASAMSPILDATDARSPESFVGIYHQVFGEDCIAVCRKIYGMDFSVEPVGYILLCLHADVFSADIFPVATLGSDASMLLMDENGGVVLAQKNAALPDTKATVELLSKMKHGVATGSEQSFITSGGDTVLYSYNKPYHLFLVSLLPQKDIEREIGRVRTVIVVFALILMAVCYVLSTTVYRSISSPISRIVEACKLSGSEAAYQPIADTAPDELGYLSRAIDAMEEKNETMLQDLELKDRQKRDLEMEMLQYQINPHFLFNTLNALKWIATINGVENLSSGISSLAGVLRNTLEKKDELISIEEEIVVLQDYCAIQNLRYTGQFHVEYLVDDDCLSFKIPRFLLQPLVENAILHGMRGGNTILNIQVQCSFADSFLQIVIRDDGVGFDVPDAMDEKTGQFSGIGLSNVDKRLQLFYGEGHRLQIQSEKNVGTTCQINIPLEPDPSIT